MSRTVYGLGKWIVDDIKLIDTFPVPHELVCIDKEYRSGGGGPFNVLMNLAALDNDIQLYGLGRWGDDERGTYLEKELHTMQVHTDFITRRSDYATSVSIVLTEKANGTRSFLFYDSGIDDTYTLDDFSPLFARDMHDAIVYIGYLNLYKGLEACDDTSPPLYVSLCAMLQERGAKIVADCVSLFQDAHSFEDLVHSVMPYIDVLILNEVEFGHLCRSRMRKKDNALDHHLLRRFMREMRKDNDTKLIVHFPEGAYLSAAQEYFVASYPLGHSQIKGTVGAGDAFCAGVINAMLDNRDHSTMLQEAHAMAYFNLQAISSVGSQRNIVHIREFIAHHTHSVSKEEP